DKGSIIYIEFGSYYVISTKLMEGIGDGLLKCGRLFLWKNGIRVNAGESGVVEKDEFNRCITIAMGSRKKREEFGRYVKKWSDLAKEAMKKNCSSNMNLKGFANVFVLGHDEYESLVKR
uniref:Uncharacterized protein n=1 Tax=Solanum lycopersicum TaxID=4081 RepID=A0A3Q7GJX9_SOLLC